MSIFGMRKRHLCHSVLSHLHSDGELELKPLKYIFRPSKHSVGDWRSRRREGPWTQLAMVLGGRLRRGGFDADRLNNTIHCGEGPHSTAGGAQQRGTRYQSPFTHSNHHSPWDKLFINFHWILLSKSGTAFGPDQGDPGRRLS